MKITAKYLAFTSLTTQCSQGRSDTGVREFRAKSTGSAALMTLELAGNDSSHSVIRERASGWNLHANMLGQQKQLNVNGKKGRKQAMFTFVMDHHAETVTARLTRLRLRSSSRIQTSGIIGCLSLSYL